MFLNKHQYRVIYDQPTADPLMSFSANSNIGHVRYVNNMDHTPSREADK